MKEVVLDFDNTMGLEEKDVDDGLALIYLLGRNDIKIKGVTTVFGNGEFAQVKKATEAIFSDLRLNELPLEMGAENPEVGTTPASDFLVEKADSSPEGITILAIGPLTNLKNAYNKDQEFFKKINEIILMGGITKPIKVGDREVGELNFSCDPEAAELVLNAPTSVTVAESNLCLQAYFNEDDWKRLNNHSSFIFNYISTQIENWYFAQKSSQNKNGTGFHMWDLVSAVYLTHPELYSRDYRLVKSSYSDLETGKLVLEEKSQENISPDSSGIINIPRTLKDTGKFKDIIFNSWEDLAEKY